MTSYATILIYMASILAPALPLHTTNRADLPTCNCCCRGKGVCHCGCMTPVPDRKSSDGESSEPRKAKCFCDAGPTPLPSRYVSPRIDLAPSHTSTNADSGPMFNPPRRTSTLSIVGRGAPPNRDDSLRCIVLLI